jgi:ABC-2 type transport system ATP-binding protein
VDPVERRRFWDLIDELAESGTTVFFSTHYMEEAEYCHRLALLNRGRLIALDTPTALRSRVVSPILWSARTTHPARSKPSSASAA